VSDEAFAVPRTARLVSICLFFVAQRYRTAGLRNVKLNAIDFALQQRQEIARIPFAYLIAILPADVLISMTN
jgi:hypothetical protein